MGLGHSPRIVTDGLVLCLDAANARSYPGTGTAWLDLASDNNLTLINSPTFQEDNGGRFQFDGTDEYGDFSNFDITGGNNYTISVVFSQTFGGSTYKYILDDSQSQSGFGMRAVNNTDMHFFAYDSAGGDFGGAIRQTRTNIFTESQIYDLTFILKTSAIQSYINGGSKVSTSAIPNNITASSATMRLGANSQTGAEKWSGEFYSVKIYNRVLSDDEVRQNYEATKGRYE